MDKIDKNKIGDCALQQNIHFSKSKYDETVDRRKNVEYNYLENSLRIVRCIREDSHSVRHCPYVSSGAVRGGRIYFQTA